MKESKLIKLLKSLSQEEFRQFSKFLQQSFVKAGKDVTSLFQILKKAYPEFDKPHLEKDKLFKKVFPKHDYSDIKLRNLIRRLTRVTEDFLLFQELQKDNLKRKEMLVEVYGKRNIYDLFKRGAEALLDNLDKAPIRDMDYYKKRFSLHRMIHFHPDTLRNTVKTEHIRELDHNLNHFFILSKLYFGVELLNRDKILPEKNEIWFLDEVLEKLDYKGIDDLPLLNIYQKLIELLKTKRADATFSEIKQLMIRQLHNLSQSDKTLILIILLNYTVWVYYQGDESLLNEQLDLYHIGLKNEVLLVNNRITSQTFMNMVITAAVLKKFEAVDSFIENNKGYLDSKNREEILTLCSAFIAFHKNDFEKTDQLLLTFTPKHPTILLGSRFLLIMNQFEILCKDPDIFETFKYQLTAFAKFIQRNSQLPENRKPPFLNFSKITGALAQHRMGFEKKELDMIEEKLNASNDLVAKHWLKLKLADMRKL